jgi:hypothetical protein
VNHATVPGGSDALTQDRVIGLHVGDPRIALGELRVECHDISGVRREPLVECMGLWYARRVASLSSHLVAGLDVAARARRRHLQADRC